MNPMDKDKLKLIVRNLELLVDSLKAEIYSDVSAYTPPKKIFPPSQIMMNCMMMTMDTLIDNV